MLYRAKTYHKPVCRSYTSRPSDPDAKYQLAKFGHAQKAKFRVLTFTFRFLSSLVFSLFLPHFFSLAGHLVGFILVGIVFRKAFRIIGLGERKGRWVMEQDFHGDVWVSVTWFFASFSGVLDWVVLILVWFERSLHSAQVSEESCPWPLKLMTSRRVDRTWIRTGSYGRFRGKWVNEVVVVVKKCWLGNFFCNFLRIYLQYYCGDLSIMATFFSVLKVAIVERFIGIFFCLV